jgi:hypothetical protein
LGGLRPPALQHYFLTGRSAFISPSIHPERPVLKSGPGQRIAVEKPNARSI